MSLTDKTTDQTLISVEAILGMSNAEGDFWCMHFLEEPLERTEGGPDAAVACVGCDTCGISCGT